MGSGVRLWRDLLLPPKFHTDDEDVEFEQQKSTITTGFPSSESSSSNPSSPATSDPCSMEAAEAGDDYIVQLARQMARDMLQEPDDDHSSVPISSSPRNPKFWGLDSPQSTLCGIGSCETLHPTISDAAVKSEKTNLKGGAAAHPKKTSTGSQSHSVRRDLLFDQSKLEKTQRERGSLGRRGRRKFSGGGCGAVNGGRFRSQPQKETPQAEQAAGSGMVAIFLGGAAAGGSNSGTGVFLPPGIAPSTESHKNYGCATALIPARVVRALKLDQNNMGVLCRPKTTNFHQQQHHDARTNGLFSKETRHHEISLPQEWTY